MLDALSNPYSPGAGIPPPALVGRDAEIYDFDLAAQRMLLGRSDRSQMLVGLRGVGKTVLLRRFGRIAVGRGWRSQHLECVEDIDFVRAAAQLARTVILDLSVARRARFAEWASRAVGVLKSFQITWEIPGGGSLVVGADAEPIPGRADSGDLGRDLTDLFRSVGQLAESNETGVLFTIDEIQYLPAARLTPLLLALHEISQLQLPLLVAGAGLPSVRGLLGEARTYAERLFTFVSMGSLSREAAGEALVRPAAREGIRWEQAAIDEVLCLSAGYPYFIQEFGKQTWRVAAGTDRITRPDVLTAVPIVKEALDEGFFSIRFERATKVQRAYVSAMASLGPGPYRSGAVAEFMGRTTQQVSTVRDSLIKRGVCFAPARGVIEFTVPMFDDYVRRRIR